MARRACTNLTGGTFPSSYAGELRRKATCRFGWCARRWPRGRASWLLQLKGEELYQLYVSSQARGAGVTAALIVDTWALELTSAQRYTLGRRKSCPTRPPMLTSRSCSRLLASSLKLSIM